MRRPLLPVLVLGIAFTGVACGVDPTRGPGGTAAGKPGRSYSYPVIDLPSAPTKSGTAVVILVDTSGSMSGQVKDHDGKPRPKSVIARDALNRIVEQTETWKKKHPNSHLQFGIYSFSGVVTEVLAPAEFDAAKAKAALGRLPGPTGGTAIGRALEAGFQALYRTGCSRKHLICISDGENTSGPGPDAVGRQLYDQTKGAVAMHFVAFDVSSRHFAFVKDINGETHDASDGAALQTAMTNIYEKRILVEAPEPEK
jgi:hypothetical protein